MRAFLIFVILIRVHFVLADNLTYIYKNKNNCQVEISLFENYYTITSSKKIDDNYERISVSISKNFDDAEIIAYCSEYNKPDADVDIRDNQLSILCLNNKANVKMDLQVKNGQLKLSYFNFTGHHYSFFVKKNDSFSCTDLEFSRIEKNPSTNYK